MKKVYINKTNCISPLGFNLEDNWEALQKGKTGIALVDQLGNIENFYASKIDDAALDKAFETIEKNGTAFTRLEKMLLLALQPLIRIHGIQEDTVLIISTTKGNIEFLKSSNLLEADLNVLAEKIAQYYGFSKPPIIVCNACVSGVLALSVAKRLIQMNQFSAAYVVAGDVLSEFVVSGFNSFQAMSSLPCRPYDKDREGVSLGEAAAAAYVSSTSGEYAVEILGEASISDANHISGPSRTGEGLYQSISKAILEADINPNTIDMISAHGTATLFNDEMEAIALNRLGLQDIPLHSLKGYYGHTLGASGLLEVVMVIESMKNNVLIVSKGFNEMGTSEKLNITTTAQNTSVKRVLKTASGFGGTNAAILLEKRY